MKRGLTYMLIFAAVYAVVLVPIIGCSDAGRAKFGGINEPHRVTLYSGGVVVGTWETAGMVKNEEQSDGFYFMDKKTDKLVRIAGTMVVERL